MAPCEYGNAGEGRGGEKYLGPLYGNCPKCCWGPVWQNNRELSGSDSKALRKANSFAKACATGPDKISIMNAIYQALPGE